MFVSSVNKRLSTRAVQYMLQKYDVNPHKLRHTFCQKLINKGINLHIVAKLAGHKDVNVTKRYVGNTQPNLDNAIDQAFS
nr:site-specific integrase [Metabacillus litoralis]